MRFKKIISILFMFILLLSGCSNTSNVTPTSLRVTSNEVKLIINSERDLNDIVTLKFEPKNTTNKSVVWSCEENDIFTLSGSTIKANKLGKAIVTATSVENENLFVDVTINVYDPNLIPYSVSVNEKNGFTITGLEDKYEAGREVVFAVTVTDENKEIKNVKVNDEVLEPIEESSYKFIMPENDVIINVTLKDKEVDTPIVDASSIKYNISYDMGERKTSEKISDESKLKAMFAPVNQEQNIITSFSDFNIVYGGGYGGKESSGTFWRLSDVLKIGTTSATGSLTINLNTEVCGVKITGYVADVGCKVQMGDSNSTDWNGGSDNKTSTVQCKDMSEINKEVAENKQSSTMTFEFASTKNLRIATTNKYPFYIASIEFIITSSEA